MNDLSPRKQSSPLQVFVAFLATMIVGIGLLAAVAYAGSNDNSPSCSSDTYSTIGQVIDGSTDPQAATAC
ncbi:MAG TPA: hypothetical protein VE081_02080 [Sporichthyaceae bacterium]|nr:hypothetical protein [Sporichthyaceae bacterium]